MKPRPVRPSGSVFFTNEYLIEDFHRGIDHIDQILDGQINECPDSSHFLLGHLGN